MSDCQQQCYVSSLQRVALIQRFTIHVLQSICHCPFTQLAQAISLSGFSPMLSENDGREHRTKESSSERQTKKIPFLPPSRGLHIILTWGKEENSQKCTLKHDEGGGGGNTSWCCNGRSSFLHSYSSSCCCFPDRKGSAAVQDQRTSQHLESIQPSHHPLPRHLLHLSPSSSLPSPSPSHNHHQHHQHYYFFVIASSNPNPKSPSPFSPCARRSQNPLSCTTLSLSVS